MNWPGTVVRWSPDTIATEIDGEVSLYHPATERVAILNGTASDVWRLCDGTTTVGETIRVLATAYGVDPVAIDGEVTKVVKDLTHQGFLHQDSTDV